MRKTRPVSKLLAGATLAAPALVLMGCGGGGGSTPADAAADLAMTDTHVSPPDAAPPVDAQAPPLDAAPPVDARVPTVDAAADAVAPPDGAPPVRAAEQPTEGEAALPGPDDLTAPVGAGATRAGKVDADAERLTGPEANCRLGDFRLDNARISLCIQDEDGYGIFSFDGGTIIDAVPADRPGTDRFQELVVSPGVGAASAEHVGIVRDGSDGGPAIIRVEGRAKPSRLIQGMLPGSFLPPDFRIVTEYRLAPDSDAVDIWTWVEGDRTGGHALMADVVFFGDLTRTFAPGSHPDGTQPNPADFLAADASEVSYALRGDGPLSYISIPTSQAPVTAVTHGSVALRIGDQALIKRQLVVGRGDVEGVRPVRPGETPVTLTGAPGAVLEIDDAADLDVTRVRLDAAGQRTFSLPPGDYRVGTSPDFAGGAVRELPLSVAAAPVTRAVDTPAPGVLQVHVHDLAGTDVAARLTFTNAQGEERVRFVVDRADLQLPPGPWHLITTRGWHYTVDERDLTLVAGERQALDVGLEEVLPFEGFTTGEFHQHASPSADSDVDPRDRVLSNVTEGVGFMAPSDHDVVWDFAGLVSTMDLSDRIMVLQGTEISPLYAHFGAYPMVYHPEQSCGGGVMLPVDDNGTWRMRRAPELVADARRLGAQIIQINHPRSAPSGYFNHLGYQPGVPLSELNPDEFTQDFNSIEVFNEASDFCLVMTDWLTLLNQGWHLTAVGNSDTHSVGQPPGYPRSYIPTLADRPEGVQSAEILDALRDGAVFLGGGAVMDFPGGPMPGSTVTPVDGQAEVHVRVRTPPWSHVDHLYAFVNGQIVWETPLGEDDAPLVDFDAPVTLPVATDAHVVFLAVGPNLRYVRPGHPTFALSNPIWVDADGGGITALGNVPAVVPHFGFCQ